MRYDVAIESAIIAQIEREPTRPVILPEWCYWKGVTQPMVYIDQQPTPLVRHLYEVLIEELPVTAGLANPPGVDARNVNPHLAVRTPTLRARPTCLNGHIYTEADYVPGVGHRCNACRVAKLTGEPSPVDLNRAKTVCPQGHALVKRKNGKRRCYECPRAQQKAYRERTKGTA